MLLALSGLGYWYYQDTQERMGILRENNAKLEIAAETNQKTIDRMVKEDTINQERIDNLTENLRDAEQYNSDLRRIFQEHNLTLLAEEKPGLIEKRINEGTNEVFDSIMRSTVPR